MNHYNYYAEEGIFSTFVRYMKEKGLFYTIGRSVTFMQDILISKFLILKKKRFFQFKGARLGYFYHAYNKTWKNERAIEVPIFFHYLRSHKGRRTLEIENVLSHYALVKYDILDKYEKENGVINEDIVRFKPAKRYGLIISLSTIEHVGVDDSPPDLSKAFTALKHIQRNCMLPNGKIFLSFPANYNPTLMSIIRYSKGINVSCYKRYDQRRNLWKEAELSELGSTFNSPPEGVVFLEINKYSVLRCKK